MPVHHSTATLSEDGIITLRDVPFRRGESVEVVVLPVPKRVVSTSPYPLRGTPMTLVAPTEPISVSDWEAGE